MVSTVVVTITDGYFVGQYAGSDALAAVNIASPLFLIATAFALIHNLWKAKHALHSSRGLKTVIHRCFVVFRGLKSIIHRCFLVFRGLKTIIHRCFAVFRGQTQTHAEDMLEYSTELGGTGFEHSGAHTIRTRSLA